MAEKLFLIRLLLKNFPEQIVICRNDKTHSGFDNETFQYGLILIFAVSPEQVAAIGRNGIVQCDVVEYLR